MTSFPHFTRRKLLKIGVATTATLTVPLPALAARSYPCRVNDIV